MIGRLAPPWDRLLLDARLADMQSARRGGIAIELNHADQSNWEFPVRYTIHRIGSDDSFLMLGRDLRPIAEVQQQLVQAQLALERDYETQREMDTRYRVLMEMTRDPVMLVLIVYSFTVSVYTAGTAAPETLHMAPIAIVDEDDVLRLRPEPLENQAVDLGRRLAQAKIAADEPGVDPVFQAESPSQLHRPVGDIVGQAGDALEASPQERQQLWEALARLTDRKKARSGVGSRRQGIGR